MARARRRHVPRIRLRIRSPRVRRALRRAVLTALGVLVAINGGVRTFGGGDPHWLSPLYLREKVHALAMLAKHALAHGDDCGREAARAHVIAAARRHGVPEGLALAVAHAESSLDAHAVSRTGAMGLMQLMPSTASWLGVGDAFDPGENTDAGARYLAQLLRRYRGDRARTLAAYNLGPGRVPRRGKLQLPPETRAYVGKILGAQVLPSRL